MRALSGHMSELPSSPSPFALASMTIKIKLLLIESRIYIHLAREVDLFAKIPAQDCSKQGAIGESISCECFPVISQVSRTLTVAKLF